MVHVCSPQMHLNMRNVSPLRGSRIVSISCARAPHRLHRISAGPLGARSDMADPHRTLSSIVRIVFPELSGSSVTQTLHGSPAQSCRVRKRPIVAPNIRKVHGRRQFASLFLEVGGGLHQASSYFGVGSCLRHFEQRRCCEASVKAIVGHRCQPLFVLSGGENE